MKVYLPHIKGASLSPFQKLVLTLMKIMLNLHNYDPGFRFGGISATTVTRSFTQVLDILYVCLKPLILWSDRAALKKTLPMDFGKQLCCYH